MLTSNKTNSLTPCPLLKSLGEGTLRAHHQRLHRATQRRSAPRTKETITTPTPTSTPSFCLRPKYTATSSHDVPPHQRDDNHSLIDEHAVSLLAAEVQCITGAPPRSRPRSRRSRRA